MTDAVVTPRHPSGSFETATARIATLDRYAVLLEEAAKGGRVRRLLGRPDLRLSRLAREARELAARFRRWHHPGEWEVARTDIEDQARDCADFLRLVKEAKACGVSIT